MWVCVINMLEMKFAVVYVLFFLAAVAFVPDVPLVLSIYVVLIVL